MYLIGMSPNGEGTLLLDGTKLRAARIACPSPRKKSKSSIAGVRMRPLGEHGDRVQLRDGGLQDDPVDRGTWPSAVAACSCRR